MDPGAFGELSTNFHRKPTNLSWLRIACKNQTCPNTLRNLRPLEDLQDFPGKLRTMNHTRLDTVFHTASICNSGFLLSYCDRKPTTIKFLEWPKNSTARETCWPFCTGDGVSSCTFHTTLTKLLKSQRDKLEAATLKNF